MPKLILYHHNGEKYNNVTHHDMGEPLRKLWAEERVFCPDK